MYEISTLHIKINGKDCYLEVRSDGVYSYSNRGSWTQNEETLIFRTAVNEGIIKGWDKKK